MKGRVLIIAGSDPSGGAGIQADIKTVTALGGYAATAITSLTIQNTKGVSAVHPVSPDIVDAQINAVMDDIGSDAIKIGMIGEVSLVESLAATLSQVSKDAPIILDPVLAATSGDALARDGVAAKIIQLLAPLANLVTPNLNEAALLTDVSPIDTDSMIAAGEKLLSLGVKAALIKGGHTAGASITDVLVTEGGAELFEHARIESTSTHGTGCTLASAIATKIAQGASLSQAVASAIDYVQKAIETAPGYGAGCGPLNHGHTVRFD